MKISTLLLREPFKKIFEKTLSSFLKDYSGFNHNINWRKNKYFYNKKTGQNWYCNPLINSMFINGVNSNVFNSINGEYSYNTLHPWKSFYQRLYLMFSQSKLTFLFFSKYVVNISPPIKGAKNKLIIGGNKKIRIIDTYKKEVYVLLKHGFDVKFLEKEIYVRKAFPFLPITKINFIGNNGLWYSEQYIFGIPPNRIKGNKSKKILFSAINDLRNILDKSVSSKNLNQYAKSLFKLIENNINRITGIDKNVKNSIISSASKLFKFLLRYNKNEILIGFCHGDFHQGNILANGDNYWILDWENSGIKQIGYDLFILLLGSRMDKGYSKKIANIIDGKFDKNQIDIINNWPEIKCNNNFLKSEYLITFLLEDILFYLDEYNNDLFYIDKFALSNRSKELEKIIHKFEL